MIETKVTYLYEDRSHIDSALVEIKPPTGAEQFARFVAEQFTEVSGRIITTRNVTGWWSRDCADHQWDSSRNPHRFDIEFMLYCEGKDWATIVGKTEPTTLYSLRNLFDQKGDFRGLLQMLDPNYINAPRE